MPKQCHVMVRETARAIAAAAYELAMKDDRFYRLWKAANPDLEGEALQRKYVQVMWGDFIDEARHTLASMLQQNSCSEHLKMQIADALIKDNMLRPRS